MLRLRSLGMWLQGRKCRHKLASDMTAVTSSSPKPHVVISKVYCHESVRSDKILASSRNETAARGVNRNLTPGTRNHNCRLECKLWTVTKSMLFIEFYFIRFNNLNFVEGRKLFFIYSIKFCSHFNAPCPRSPHHSFISTLSLTSALDESGWLTSRPDRFTPGKEKR
jgi:hypothetical protein